MLELLIDDKTYALGEETTVGRTGDRDIQIPLNTVSDHHCTITFNGESYWLRDRSRNGTFVNGIPVGKVEPIEIKAGDEIRFNGSEIAHVRAGNEAIKPLVGETFPGFGAIMSAMRGMGDRICTIESTQKEMSELLKAIVSDLQNTKENQRTNTEASQAADRRMQARIEHNQELLTRIKKAASLSFISVPILVLVGFSVATFNTREERDHPFVAVKEIVFRYPVRAGAGAVAAVFMGYAGWAVSNSIKEEKDGPNRPTSENL